MEKIKALLVCNDKDVIPSASSALLGCLRLAGGYEIHAVDSNKYSPTLFSSDKKTLIPPVDSSNYLRDILSVCEKNKIDALLPCSDSIMQKINHNRDEIESVGTTLISPSEEVVEMANDKWKTYQFLEKNKICTPYTVLPEDVNNLVKEKGFPLVVKPREGTRRFGFYKCTNAHTLTEAIKTVKNPIIQEFIPTNHQEYTTGVLKDKQKELKTIFTFKRKLDREGVSYNVESGNYPEIDKLSEKICEKLDTAGPINLQFRSNSKNTDQHILEINSRFGATTKFRALLGLNEPDLMIKHMLYDEPIPKKTVTEPKAVGLRYYEEVIIPVEE